MAAREEGFIPVARISDGQAHDKIVYADPDLVRGFISLSTAARAIAEGIFCGALELNTEEDAGPCHE